MKTAKDGIEGVSFRKKSINQKYFTSAFFSSLLLTKIFKLKLQAHSSKQKNKQKLILKSDTAKTFGEVHIPFSLPKFLRPSSFLDSSKIESLIQTSKRSVIKQVNENSNIFTTKGDRTRLKPKYDNYGIEISPEPFIPFYMLLGSPQSNLLEYPRATYTFLSNKYSQMCFDFTDVNLKPFSKEKEQFESSKLKNLIFNLKSEKSKKKEDQLIELIENVSKIKTDSSNSLLEIGRLVRFQYQIGQNDNFNLGQIIRRDSNKLVLRSTEASLIPTNAEFASSHDAMVFEDDILFSYSQQKSKTGDIVQGLPKINRLFEGRKLHIVPNFSFLKTSFDLSKKKSTSTENGNIDVQTVEVHENQTKKNIYWSHYLQQQKTMSQIRLLAQIQDVYNSQGVSIADKHIEVIIRQMTSKILLLSVTDIGFFPGDTIDELFFKRIAPLYKKDIFFTPLLIGITKLSLHHPSILAPASFQETKRVLVRNALSSRVDFLGGIKEHVMVGQLIPAGTGFQTLMKKESPLSSNLTNSNKTIRSLYIGLSPRIRLFPTLRF
jgi:hypothetical protein